MVSPVPFRVIVSPGFAEAWSGSAGVPEPAVAVMLVRVDPM
jgi:hypothetical protein